MAASFRGLERWREDGRLTSVRSAQRVPPVSLKRVGVRACRALADGRLLSVNGLGVIEQFDYAWRDWQQPAEAAVVAAAAAASGGAGMMTAVAEDVEGCDEEGEGDEEDEVAGGGSDGEPGAEVKRCAHILSCALLVPVPSGACVIDVRSIAWRLWRRGGYSPLFPSASARRSTVIHIKLFFMSLEGTLPYPTLTQHILFRFPASMLSVDR